MIKRTSSSSEAPLTQLEICLERPVPSFDSKGGSCKWVDGIVAHTDAAYEHIDSLITKKGNLLVNVSTQEPVTNKKSKRETTEAGTDTDDLPA